MTKRVLIVDDSTIVRRQVFMALDQAGFDVIEAVDGEDGACKIAENPGLALVVCDINMPRMSGLEMLKAVKSDPANATLPIIMLTSEGAPELIARAKSCGAKGWIVKPFRSDLLIAAAKKLTGGS